jgi:hypothetical protein
VIDRAWDIKIEGKLNKNNIVFQEKYFKLYLELTIIDKQIRGNRGKIASNIQQKRQRQERK